MEQVPVDDPSADGGTVSIDRCESCGGSFFEFFDGEPIGLAQETLSARPPRRPGQVSRDPVCPDCGEEMGRRAYLDEGPELARCDSCLALFVSARELAALADTRLRASDKDAGGWLVRLVAWIRGR